MKPRFFLIGAILSTAVALTLLAAPDRQPADPLRLTLGDEVYTACGLDQLTSDQADRLFSALRPGHGRSYLTESAVRFMESEGWRQIEILGLRSSDPSWSLAEDFLVVADGYELLVLDPWGVDDYLPLPGFYWAKNSLSSWKIIASNGTVRDFRTVTID